MLTPGTVMPSSGRSRCKGPGVEVRWAEWRTPCRELHPRKCSEGGMGAVTVIMGCALLGGAGVP